MITLNLVKVTDTSGKVTGTVGKIIYPLRRKTRPSTDADPVNVASERQRTRHAN